MYEPMPMAFLGPRWGPTFIYNDIPTFIIFFELFWTPTMMNDIVRETNRYSTTSDSLGRTRGGLQGEEFTVDALKAFMAIALYMGMRKQSSYKTYRMKDSFFHCSKISSIFSRARFIELRRCLHLTNNWDVGNIEHGAPSYDKLTTSNMVALEWYLGPVQGGVEFGENLYN